jgi:hypothetical protein
MSMAEADTSKRIISAASTCRGTDLFNRTCIAAMLLRFPLVIVRFGVSIALFPKSIRRSHPAMGCCIETAATPLFRSRDCLS